MQSRIRKSLTAAAFVLSAFYVASALATAPTKEEVKDMCGMSGGSYSSGSNYSRCEYSNGSYSCNYDVDKCETCINGNCTVETKRPGKIHGLIPKSNALAPVNTPPSPKPTAPVKPAPIQNAPAASSSQTGQPKSPPAKNKN